MVENRAGAGGNVGADAVAKSPADGYTLLMSSGGMVTVNPHIYPKMPFDTAKDLTPVAAAARVSVFLLVSPGCRRRTFTEFLAYARANPGKLSYGSAGSGSSPHLAGEMFKREAGSRRATFRTRARRRRSTTCSAGRSSSCSIPASRCSRCRPAS